MQFTRLSSGAVHASLAALILACAPPLAHGAGWIVGAGSTLAVTGTLGGDVAVSNGGILTGAGSVNGNVSVSNGGAIAPGNPAGTLNVNDLVLNNAAVLNFGLGSASGLIQVNGNLTLDGVVNVTALSGFNGGNYRLLNYSGSLANNSLATGTLPSGYAATVDTSAAGQVNLTASTTQGGPGLVAPIPTLSEWGVILLAGMLGVFGMARVRRGNADRLV